MSPDIVRELGYLCLGSRLRRIGDRLQSDVQRLVVSNDLDIQSAHYPLLAAIYHRGPLTVGELTKELGIRQPGVTRTVGQLADLGYINIARREDDHRRKTVSLTNSGIELIEISQAKIWPAIETTLSNLCDQRNGTIMDLLDFLEDELTESSLAQRVDIQINRTTHERIAKTSKT